MGVCTERFLETVKKNECFSLKFLVLFFRKERLETIPPIQKREQLKIPALFSKTSTKKESN